MPRTRTIITAIQSFDHALEAIDLGADALAFTFTKGRPDSIDPAAAYEIMASLPPLISTIAIFANPTIDDFSDAEEQCPTTLTQLEGEEPDKLIKQIGPDVIRSLAFDPDATPQALMKWDGFDDVGSIVINAAAQGENFDWSPVAPMIDDVSKPIILAGRFTPANVFAAIAAISPYALQLPFSPALPGLFLSLRHADSQAKADE